MRFPEYSRFDSVPRLEIEQSLEDSFKLFEDFEVAQAEKDLFDLEQTVAEWAQDEQPS